MSSPVLETLDLVKNTLLLLQEEELLCTFSNRMKEPVLKKHEIPPSIVKVPLSPQIEIPIPPVQKEKILSPMPPIIATPLPSPETIPLPPMQIPTPPPVASPIATPIPSPPTPLPAKKSHPSLFRSILAKIAPHVAILDEIPNDTIAKQIANRWKTKNLAQPISIVSFGEMPSHKFFLSEIGTAISAYFAPSRVIDAEKIEMAKQWESFLKTQDLKFILICDATLWQLHNLRKFYKEVPAKNERHLGDIPVFLLPDLSLYLKDPKLKKSLWKTLCQILPRS